MSEKITIKKFKVNWSVVGIRTFAPLYRTYKGVNLTEEDVKEHHIKTIINEYNYDPSYEFIVVPKHIKIHEIKDITNDD